MTIASEVTRIQTNIANAYTACSDKGATMPDTQNSANLADTITSIPTGGGGASTHTISYYDIDGTLLYQDTVNSGTQYTVPATYTANYDPTYLTFRGWTGQKLQSVTRGVDINTSDLELWKALSKGVYRDYALGAIYTNADCYKGVLKLSIPSNNYEVEFSEGFQRSYLQSTTYFPGTYDLVIDWGDNSTNSRITKDVLLATTSTGNTVEFYPFTHTYASSGNYVIKFWFEAEGKNVTEFDYGASLSNRSYYFASGARVHFCVMSSESASLITHWYNGFACPSTSNCYFDNTTYCPPNRYTMDNLEVFSNTRTAFYTKGNLSDSNEYNFILDTYRGNNGSYSPYVPNIKCVTVFNNSGNSGLPTNIKNHDNIKFILDNYATQTRRQYENCPRLQIAQYWTEWEDDLTKANATYNTTVDFQYININNCPLAKSNPHDMQIAPRGYYSNDTSTLYMDPDEFPVAVTLGDSYKISGNYINPIYTGANNLYHRGAINGAFLDGDSMVVGGPYNIEIANIVNLRHLTISTENTYLASTHNLPTLETLSITQPSVTYTGNVNMSNLPPQFTTLDLTGCTGFTTFNTQTSANTGIHSSYIKYLKLPSSCTTFGSSGASMGVFAYMNSSEIDMSYFNDNMTYYIRGLFYQSSKLKKVKFKNTGSIPSNQPGGGDVQSSENVFYACSVLEEVELPSWIISMGGGWFQSCRYLRKVWIPSTVTTIGSGTSMSYYPFYSYSPDSTPCTIYTDASAPLSGWGQYWNAYGYSYSASKVCPVVYNATIEDYRAA